MHPRLRLSNATVLAEPSSNPLTGTSHHPFIPAGLSQDHGEVLTIRTGIPMVRPTWATPLHLVWLLRNRRKALEEYVERLSLLPDFVLCSALSYVGNDTASKTCFVGSMKDAYHRLTVTVFGNICVCFFKACRGSLFLDLRNHCAIPIYLRE